MVMLHRGVLGDYPLCMLWKIWGCALRGNHKSFLDMALLQFDYGIMRLGMLLLPCVRGIAPHFECLESKEIWACTTTKMQLCFVEWLIISRKTMSLNDDCYQRV
jgi:hypothetical protein